MNEFEQRVAYAKVKAAYSGGLKDHVIKLIMAIMPSQLKVAENATDEEIQAEVDRMAENARG